MGCKMIRIVFFFFFLGGVLYYDESLIKASTLEFKDQRLKKVKSLDSEFRELFWGSWCGCLGSLLRTLVCVYDVYDLSDPMGLEILVVGLPYTLNLNSARILRWGALRYHRQ